MDSIIESILIYSFINLRLTNTVLAAADMSFVGGGGGASCSVGNNPLAQVAKQQGVDRSLQQDRIAGNGVGSHRSAMRGDPRQISQLDNARLQQMQRPDTFQFDGMRREIPRPSNDWAHEFSKTARPTPHGPETSRASPRPQNNWAAEFKGPGTHPDASMTAHSGYQRGNYVGYEQPMSYGPRMHFTPTTNYAQGIAHMAQNNHQKPENLDVSNEKWQEMFNKAEASLNEVREAAADTTVSEAQNESVDQDKAVGVEDAYDERWFNESMYPPDWDSVWSQIQNHDQEDMGDPQFRVDNSDASANVWERDFNRFATSRTSYADYQFQQDNPYVTEEDPFSIGCALMDNGAKLSVAALCFEAALQHNPQHVEAWSRLGDAQAQNEVEDVAIAALEQCVKLDPHNEKGLMNLAVSYTNEGYESAASATLERWLATKYPDLVNRAASENPALTNDFNHVESLHKRVTDLFLKAALLSPDGANMDADVQVGLGVLLYRNEEYTKAVDCFRAALSVRPDDALLWNRLGATLANAARPEEAIEAYYKALELRPSFVRARCNLGVSCVNIGCYHEAAEHLLSAMSLHQTTDDDHVQQSTNLMETLRRVFLAMDRHDLLAKVRPDMRLDEFRNEFRF